MISFFKIILGGKLQTLLHHTLGLNEFATFGEDFLVEGTTQGRTKSPSDGAPLYQMILGILGHHGAHLCRLSGCNNLQMWLPQPGSLRAELFSFVANSECHLDPV